MKYVVGIDYSLTCPSIAIFNGDNFSFENCQFHFLTDRKKFELQGQLNGYFHKEYSCSELRYHQLSEWVVSHLPTSITSIALEGYSFGSRGGRAFDIGEATGLLKHKLYMLNYNVLIVPPTVVKKIATGKGNADKIKMAEAFLNETKRNLYEEFNCSLGKSPISDIIDSYYICKIAYHKDK